MATSDSFERKLLIFELVFLVVGTYTLSGADSFRQQIDEKLAFVPAESFVGRPEKGIFILLDIFHC